MPGPQTLIQFQMPPGQDMSKCMDGWRGGGGQGGKPSAPPKNCISLEHCVV